MVKRETKRSLKEAKERQTEENAVLSFAKHEIVSRSADRILIQQRYSDGGWSSNFSVELVLLRNGLLVYGDIAPVIFAYYSSKTIEGALSWLSEKMGSSYVAEKAQIGMRLDGMVRAVNHQRLASAHAAILKARQLVRAAAELKADQSDQSTEVGGGLHIRPLGAPKPEGHS